MSLLDVQTVSAHHGLLEAVRGVSFDIAQGDILALVGANGAGKTTLLRTIAGAHAQSSGKVIFRGRDISALPSHIRVAQGLALVPEGRCLFTKMTVLENLMLARSAGRKGPWTIETVLEAFPNLKDRRHHACGHLSGGEQQATAIGRALMTNPDLILLDEVSLGLSPLVVDRVYAQLGGLVASGTTIILVEQDLNRAMRIATHVICMLEGQIVLRGGAGGLTREAVTSAYFGLGRAAMAGGVS